MKIKINKSKNVNSKLNCSILDPNNSYLVLGIIIDPLKVKISYLIDARPNEGFFPYEVESEYFEIIDSRVSSYWQIGYLKSSSKANHLTIGFKEWFDYTDSLLFYIDPDAFEIANGINLLAAKIPLFHECVEMANHLSDE